MMECDPKRVSQGRNASYVTDDTPILNLGDLEKPSETFRLVLLGTNVVQLPEHCTLFSVKMQPDNKQKMLCFPNKYRYLILILGWICLTILSSNMNLYNMTKLCMPENLNGTIRISFTEVEHNNLIMAAAVGTALATAPFSWILTRYKAKYPFLFSGIISLVSTVLIPLFYQKGFICMWILRFMQGVGYAADFGTMGILCSVWAPLSQSALFISILTCYSSLSVLFSSPIVGLLCNSRFGWESAYYTHAAITTILLILWMHLYADYPAKSSYTSHKECEKIQKNKSLAHKQMKSNVPYSKILRSKLVWIIWVNAFTDIFSGIFSQTYQPTYLSKVLQYDVTQVGFLAIMGPAAHIPLKFLFGTMSDHIKSFNERHKMIVFNSIAVFGPALSYLFLAFSPTDRPILSILAFMSNGIFFSTAGGGFYKCATICCRQYAHVIIARPVLMNIFVHDIHDQSQWRLIFLLLSGSLFIANILFAIVATDEPAEFTKTDSATNVKPPRNLKPT
ncbi:unnamed protein product [Bursaphelenchus xylophilus]|uniref:(pine wood nematode) hypothetical protein n=1 Tax=Bursaphelenchus xylophilus TaxID=6326 RepID=A0A1I7S3J4_BURXY|nr:unnamed protein product [Bursaphelenchus xylophilus]CAG9116350.1 unnamed protein product [Bursaphelenchus xylophilus]